MPPGGEPRGDDEPAGASNTQEAPAVPPASLTQTGPIPPGPELPQCPASPTADSAYPLLSEDLGTSENPTPSFAPDPRLEITNPGIQEAPSSLGVNEQASRASRPPPHGGTQEVGAWASAPSDPPELKGAAPVVGPTPREGSPPPPGPRPGPRTLRNPACLSRHMRLARHMRPNLPTDRANPWRPLRPSGSGRAPAHRAAHGSRRRRGPGPRASPTTAWSPWDRQPTGPPPGLAPQRLQPNHPHDPLRSREQSQVGKGVADIAARRQGQPGVQCEQDPTPPRQPPPQPAQ